ncbi:Hypothetical predicted protein [Lecanosticta acicola]|uniref:F-box domain-containing protein n=1 Tax=Lecanosticta acicola TaxID=111012 RepID=A0AAI8Z329_9PEZI|nr:Hypothetical predicted protein [Lecanosticta acicola]
MERRSIQGHGSTSDEDDVIHGNEADGGPCSLLLDLPAELRHNVYDAVMGVEAARLIPRTKGRLATSTSLPRVNRQIREDFLSYVYLRAPLIIASVYGFDFRHVVTFFNRLSEKELKGLSRDSELRISRKIVIQLDLGPIPKALKDTMGPNFSQDALGDFPYLRSWLKRSEDPTKKGTSVDISYLVDDLENPDLRHWAWHLDYMGQLLPAEGHQKKELLKIIAAVNAAMLTD